MAKLLRLFMMTAILAKKLDDAVSKADSKLLTSNKYNKFFEILAILFIQYLMQNIFHNESITLYRLEAFSIN